MSVFTVRLNSDNSAVLFTVSSPEELKQKINSSGLLNSTFVIQNHKGEYCNSMLEVIPHPSASMESMVGLLQSKFGSSKRK